VATSSGETPDHIKRMQQELFYVLSEARCREELRLVETNAQEVRTRYFEGLESTDVGSWPFIIGLAD
jgi:hypothetical protein